LARDAAHRQGAEIPFRRRIQNDAQPHPDSDPALPRGASNRPTTDGGARGMGAAGLSLSSAPSGGPARIAGTQGRS